MAVQPNVKWGHPDPRRVLNSTLHHIPIGIYFAFKMNINSSLGDTPMKTQTTVRVDQDSYTQAKEILKYLGLSYSQAVNIFNNMIVSTKGIPFEIKIPNNITLKSMEEAKALDGDFVTLDDFKK